MSEHDLSALKVLSQSGWPQPLIRMFDYAQWWTVAVKWRSVEEARRELDDCNAFLDLIVAGKKAGGYTRREVRSHEGG